MALFLFFGEERSTRCRKRCSLALPYMLLFMSFSRFTCPSRGPLLHGRVNHAKPAAFSCWILLANDLISGNVLASTDVSHDSYGCPEGYRSFCMQACMKR